MSYTLIPKATPLTQGEFDTKYTNSSLTNGIIKTGDNITQLNNNAGYTNYSSSDFNNDFNSKSTDDLNEGLNKFVSETQKDNIPIDNTFIFNAPKLASSPAGATTGQIYYNTTDNNIYYYSGSEWKQVNLGLVEED